jgi:hypothetical protein
MSLSHPSVGFCRFCAAVAVQAIAAKRWSIKGQQSPGLGLRVG